VNKRFLPENRKQMRKMPLLLHLSPQTLHCLPRWLHFAPVMQTALLHCPHSVPPQMLHCHPQSFAVRRLTPLTMHCRKFLQLYQRLPKQMQKKLQIQKMRLMQ
jgi:hypothetical protein